MTTYTRYRYVINQDCTQYITTEKRELLESYSFYFCEGFYDEFNIATGAYSCIFMTGESPEHTARLIEVMKVLFLPGILLLENFTNDGKLSSKKLTSNLYINAGGLIYEFLVR